jgi:hypothetical protein
MLVCVFLHNFARETAGAARIRHSPRPLILVARNVWANLGRIVPRERGVMSAKVIERGRATPRLSSPGLTGRPSIPEMSMMEPRNRGVLDTPHARGTTTVNGARQSSKRRWWARSALPTLRDLRKRAPHPLAQCNAPSRPPHAVSAAFNPSRASTVSRITNFWILPVTVIGNSSTNST